MTDLTPDSNGRIGLEDIVQVLADGHEIGQRANFTPTEGRVLEDSEDGTIYLGDGTQWLTVGSGSGVTTPSLDVSGSTSLSGPFNTEKSVTVSEGEATDTLHYGSNQDRGNAGDDSVAIGIGARANGDDGSGGTIGNHVVVGYQAAENNTGDRVTATGYQAAENNTGDRVTATGYQAAQNNTVPRVTALGYHAARANTGVNVTASGYQAAENNTGNRVTALGYKTAQGNTGDQVTVAGHKTAQNNTGNRVTAVGLRAAQGDGLADPTTMGDSNIGIGPSAIRNNQASGLIAIGKDAGINAQTDDQLIITDRTGTRRMVMDLTNGDLKIDGSLTENASL